MPRPAYRNLSHGRVIIHHEETTVRYLLAFETSCDETAVAVFDLSTGMPRLVGEEISSQTELHKLYGGVVPELASREHLRALPLLTHKLLSEHGLSFQDCGVLAVTQGPGLKGCLLMGIGFAQGISLAHTIPLMGVNHIEGHALSAQMDNPELTPPYLVVIVSGGHTEIHLVEAQGRYRLIARTIDDAAGEAFDKSANLLHFEYPGGPKLAALADTVTATRFVLPRVMREAQGFSFSGLKTAIALRVREQGAALEDPVVRAELAHAIQGAIVEAIAFKVRQAVAEIGVSVVALCGGVAANRALRAALAALPGVRMYAPTLPHCMDNAAMIGYAAGLRILADRDVAQVGQALVPRARWPLEEL
ncbi:MAG: tRNA (adenosine(37)-N6)-threonylcarbamoyltransferase complex transferase subunit TsaD [Proteobacteria bacterium]|nr:tRNA (adenosine(37)-N6)-threonylcarbamoyltransferase complex transferase subunit TsaD [Pseudomonadota bacterium]